MESGFEKICGLATVWLVYVEGMERSMVIVFPAEHVEEGTETVATFEFWG
jgi:hypothetical protein